MEKYIKIESSEDDGLEKTKMIMEVSSEQYNLQLKTVKQEEDSISEDTFERNKIKLQDEGNANCGTDVRNANDGSEVQKQHNLNTETHRFNGSNISVKVDYTHSDADDDKCLSSIKTEKLEVPIKAICYTDSGTDDVKNTDDGSEAQKQHKFNNETYKREHECEKCHHKYASKKNLKCHIKLKHIKAEETNEHILPETKVEGSLRKREIRPLCYICGASVCNKAQLIIHMRRHTGEKPFKCELCDRGFLQITDLNSHRRIHTGEKPYKCNICEKAFRVSTKLTKHMRSHTDERPYKCPHCERSFKYSKDLNIHNRIHTGERPYSCNVCGNTFTQSNSLKTHRMKLGHTENAV